MLDWRKLVSLSDGELAQLDIAAVNLACAVGLPGAESLNLGAAAQTLDRWAVRIRLETERLQLKFYETDYDSEARWRVSLMITMLWRDFGVRYNLAKRSLDVPLEPADSFIHGILCGEGGTCASLPVLYAAVGRRLGYPVKLAHTQGPAPERPDQKVGHCFARWEGADSECFNIDSLDGRLCSAPDSYYRTEYQVTAEAEKHLGLIRSNSPREELAGFLKTRAFCWAELKQHRKAIEALIPACDLAPYVGSFNTLGMFMFRWNEQLEEGRPLVMPELVVQLPERQFPYVPEELERRFFHINALDVLLQTPEYRQRWWDPMVASPGHLPADLPAKIAVRYRGDGLALDFYPRTERDTRKWHEIYRQIKEKQHV